MQPHRAPIAETRVSDQAVIEADRSAKAISAANALLSEGYIITSIQTETRVDPVIWVLFDMRLAALVAHDDACYYKNGVDEVGKYRVGQHRRLGCLVQWRERPGKAAWSH